MEEKAWEKKLLEVLRTESKGRHAYVCFSGGLDSAVVVAACRRAGLPVTAVMAVGPALPAQERQDAHDLAARLGVPLEEIDARETEHPAYRANQGDRCYHCKTAIYRTAAALAHTRHPDAWILNGSQVEDLLEYRPGMDAAREQGIFAPLLEAGLNKAAIRSLARSWGLPLAEKPASPCLASRFPVGTEVTPERLRMVEAVERCLQERGLWPARARFHGAVVRIEVPGDRLVDAVSEPHRSALETAAREAGFSFVALDLAGLQRGSLSFALPEEGRP